MTKGVGFYEGGKEQKKKKKKKKDLQKCFRNSAILKTRFSHFVKEEHALEPEQKASLPKQERSHPVCCFCWHPFLPGYDAALSNLHGP